MSTSVRRSEDNYPPSAWLAEWPLPVLIDDDDGSIRAATGLRFFPYTIVVAPDGTVAARVSGVVPIESLIAFTQELSAPQR